MVFNDLAVGKNLVQSIFRTTPIIKESRNILDTGANLFFAADYHDFFENYAFEQSDNYAKAMQQVATAINSTGGAGGGA